jgi:hypothetical protein
MRARCSGGVIAGPETPQTPTHTAASTSSGVAKGTMRATFPEAASNTWPKDGCVPLRMDLPFIQ